MVKISINTRKPEGKKKNYNIGAGPVDTKCGSRGPQAVVMLELDLLPCGDGER